MSGKEAQKHLRCLCCRSRTVPPGLNAVCPVCFWEDCSLADQEPNRPFGANKVSLNEARANFKKFGASQEKFITLVRDALVDERS